MTDDLPIYGVIAEWKNEAPIVMENKPMTYTEAYDRMSKLCESNRIIRVAIFSFHYTAGNETLIAKNETKTLEF
jgi:hypothetical protein